MALGTPAPLATFDVASASAPTNIAVVKYWGKDEARGGNTPINSSCSLTLDPADLRAETVMVASPELDRDELWLNGAPVDVAGASTHARRLRACLATMRARRSGVARVGSGSACRSLDGGLVAWRKGAAPDASDSLADPLHAADHWPGLRVVVVVASAGEKETPSTEGMRRSVATSPFLAHRAAAVAEPRVAELAAAFGARDRGVRRALRARARGPTVARARGATSGALRGGLDERAPR
ncbi:diphosphomevalonate decarboxylase [Aureococcus anophagefferens]|nr:diphosphomevalonate decarboxylase [Aureococcus anophagefferens]